MIDLHPDLSLRQSSAAALVPLFLTYYALAVLAILPNTFFFKLLLQPIFVWQAWGCVLNVDFSAWLAQSLGLQNSDRVNFWNSPFVMGVFVMVLKSLEWTFIIEEPLRKYEFTMDQNKNAPIEKRLSISSVLLDAFDLFCSLRGVGWSWSPFQQRKTPPSESIPTLFASLLFNITIFDTSLYVIQRVCPAVSNPSGGSLFDPNLSLSHRIALAAFSGICGGVWAYSLIEMMYRVVASVGRVVFRQPASRWPPVSHRPWLSTSIHEFWTIRWHQLFRHLFIVFGARTGGALLGRTGALMGAFAVSAAMHHVAVWGMGFGSEFSTAGGFFLLMGLGVAMEVAFQKVTGVRVQGFSGWLWTMSWTLVWGTLMLDGWARHGMLASDFFPSQLRPGKALVDAIIGLTKSVVAQ